MLAGLHTSPPLHWPIAPPWLQLPPPSHVVGAVNVLPMQLGLAHVVPNGQPSHMPALQFPSVPHVDCAVDMQMPRGSGTPFFAGPQLPFEPPLFFALEHAWHAWLQALLQQ